MIASLLVMKAPDPHLFKSGRDFAAWLGLTPRDHSTAGKARPGRITRAGDPMLRSLLVVGATAVIWRIAPGRGEKPVRLACKRCIERKPAKLAAVALANKMARIAWKLMASGERYARRRRGRRWPPDEIGGLETTSGLGRADLARDGEMDGIVRSATGDKPHEATAI